MSRIVMDLARRNSHNPMTPADLKTTRAQLGLTQSQLAKQLGVTVSTVAKWEQAIHPIPTLASKLLRTIKRPR